VNRRDFVCGAVASASVLLLSGCEAENKPAAQSEARRLAPVPPAPRKPITQGRSREDILALVDDKADYSMRLCHNCAQASFLTLHEVFGLGDASLVKALTPLPGIAERGETCGAVTGCLLALGLVYGRDRLDDWAGWRACLVPARKFCEQFEKEMGSTQCGDIVEKLFGQRYNLADPVDLGKFQEAGPTEKCGGVVRQAARIAAGLILDRR
jgi:C_GCAxxG_C_C family probable redox protein